MIGARHALDAAAAGDRVLCPEEAVDGLGLGEQLSIGEHGRGKEKKKRRERERVRGDFCARRPRSAALDAMRGTGGAHLPFSKTLRCSPTNCQTDL